MFKKTKKYPKSAIKHILKMKKKNKLKWKKKNNMDALNNERRSLSTSNVNKKSILLGSDIPSASNIAFPTRNKAQNNFKVENGGKMFKRKWIRNIRMNSLQSENKFVLNGSSIATVKVNGRNSLIAENSENNKKRKRKKKKRRKMAPQCENNTNENSDPCPDCLRIQSERENELPVKACQDKLVQHLKENETLIIIGETGAGKSTQVPQIVYKEILKETGRIAITQPRRVAVLSLSSRVAEELNSEVGDIVGYSIRFDTVKSNSTKILFFTDGMLIREFFNDKLLLSYDYVILDEAHERTVHTDILFGLVKNAQKYRRKRGHKQLKVLVMSATMSVDRYSDYFNKARVIYLKGRIFPIEVYHYAEDEEVDDYISTCLILVFKIHKSAPANHDILVILTGQNEIEAAAQTINKIASELHDYPKVIVRTLYSSMDPYKQQSVFLATPEGCRKIILSTNIAETSVTIKGIKYVVDSGKVKVKTYDNVTGIERLKVQPISKAQAFQRAGRVGRESDGIVYRAYTIEQYKAMQEFTVPEILRCNLSTVVLSLLHMIINPYSFDFMDMPSKEDITEAMNELVELGAARITDTSMFISKLGHKMALLPLDPRYSKILLSAPSYGCLTEIITIIAFLSADSIFINPTTTDDTGLRLEMRNQFSSPRGDLITFLNIYKAYKSLRDNKDDWCHKRYLNKFNINYALKVRKQLATMCKDVLHLEMVSCNENIESICKCLLTGLYKNTATLKSNRTYFTAASSRPTKIHPASVICNNSPNTIMFCEMIELNEIYLKNVTVVDTEWIPEVVPNFAKNKKKVNLSST